MAATKSSHPPFGTCRNTAGFTSAISFLLSTPLRLLSFFLKPRSSSQFPAKIFAQPHRPQDHFLPRSFRSCLLLSVPSPSIFPSVPAAACPVLSVRDVYTTAVFNRAPSRNTRPCRVAQARLSSARRSALEVPETTEIRKHRNFSNRQWNLDHIIPSEHNPAHLLWSGDLTSDKERWPTKPVTRQNTSQSSRPDDGQDPHTSSPVPRPVASSAWEQAEPRLYASARSAASSPGSGKR